MQNLTSRKQVSERPLTIIKLGLSQNAVWKFSSKYVCAVTTASRDGRTCQNVRMAFQCHFKLTEYYEGSPYCIARYMGNIHDQLDIGHTDKCIGK